jgi:hypothetical protein
MIAILTATATPVYADTTHCGQISADENWSNTGNVHVVTCNVTVDSGVTLTIQEGAIVKFDEGTVLGVNGVLKVEGTATSPVQITSLKDDSVGGDTNGDGNATSPAPGDWGHISFLDTSVDSENLIEHAVIRYGGHFFNNNNFYYPDCWDCTFSGAVRFHDASPTISYNHVTLSQVGLQMRNSTPTLVCNDIEGNNAYGLYNESVDNSVSAENQWWGSTSGPTHSSNPNGTGDAASDGVDFIPWETSSCLGTPIVDLDVQIFLPAVFWEN